MLKTRRDLRARNKEFHTVRYSRHVQDIMPIPTVLYFGLGECWGANPARTGSLEVVKTPIYNNPPSLSPFMRWTTPWHNRAAIPVSPLHRLPKTLHHGRQVCRCGTSYLPPNVAQIHELLAWASRQPPASHIRPHSHVRFRFRIPSAPTRQGRQTQLEHPPLDRDRFVFVF